MASPTFGQKFSVEVDVTGVTEAADVFKQLGARAYGSLPLMEAMKEKVFAMQRQRVMSSPWQPLKDSTVTRKLEQGEDPSIFRDEWRPIKGQATRVGNKLWLALTLDGATGQIKRATRTTCTFGVNSKGNNQLFYARFVQNVRGTQRQILAFSRPDAVAIGRMCSNWILYRRL